jgi:1,2-diacylglycerol 3-alpha-glucosyltransferase
MSESLCIAFYTDTFLPAVDGVVTSILNFRQELMRRGHDVYVFASGDSNTKAMTKMHKNIFVTNGMKFKNYPQYNLALFPFLSTLKLSRVKVDVIHAHTPFTMGFYALLQAKVSRTPLVGSFHTLFTDKAVLDEYITDVHLRKLAYRYSWPYAKFFYNKCDEVIAPSETIKTLLGSKGIGCGNTCVVPNSVDLKRFNTKVDGGKTRKHILNGKKGKVVMYVGRLSKEKRLDTFIKAARLLKDKDINFVICGDGPARSYYHEMVSSMHLNKVKFTGFIDHKALPEHYAACDLFCIPSTFETQGIVSVEAMASGKPVVGADYLALKELIKNGYNGEKFAPGDFYGCARKIEKVLYNIDSYKGMVDTAKKYSIEKTTDELLSSYKAVIGRAKF